MQMNGKMSDGSTPEKLHVYTFTGKLRLVDEYGDVVGVVVEGTVTVAAIDDEDAIDKFERHFHLEYGLILQQGEVVMKIYRLHGCQTWQRVVKNCRGR